MTNRLKRTAAGLALVASLSGCVSQATQNALVLAQQGCMMGDPNACIAVPAIQLQAANERNQSEGLAAAILLLPLLILAAGAGGGGYHHGGYYHGGGWHH